MSSSSSSSFYSNHAASLVGRSINTIHNALDNQQYTKAIRLCLEILSIVKLPSSTETSSSSITTTTDPPPVLIVFILLAHAYAKARQKYKSVITILQMFGINTNTTNTTQYNKTNTTLMFPELQFYIQYARYEREAIVFDSDEMTSISAVTTTTTTTSTTTATTSNKKSQKQTQKKGTTISQTQPTNHESSSSSRDLSSIWDWIDQLNIPPTILPQHCYSSESESSSPVALLSQNHFTNVLCYDSSMINTLAITLQHILKLPYTAYQIYTWAFQTVLNHPTVSRTPQNYDTIQSYGYRAYMIGVGLLAIPQFSNIHTMLLTQLQVLALQMTRIQQQNQQQQQLFLNRTNSNTNNATEYCSLLWATQIALWKYTLIPPMSSPISNAESNTENQSQQQQQQQQKRNMLLRLAESMAYKCIEMYSQSYQTYSDDINLVEQYNQIGPTQSYLLYIKTLQLQKKYIDIMQYIKDRLTTTSVNHTNNIGIPSRQTLLEIKADALQHILIEAQQMALEGIVHNEGSNSFTEQQQQELKITLEELLHMFPDDWIYWQQYCDACCNYIISNNSNNNVLEGCSMIETFRLKIIQLHQQNPSITTNGGEDILVHGDVSFPYRGPQLLHVELALRRMLFIVKQETHLQSSNDLETYTVALIESIMQYGELWSSRATCAYSDISPYLDQCLQHTTIDQIRTLLHWSQSMISTNCVLPIPVADAADIDHVLKHKIRQRELRTYIFAVQIQFQIARHFDMDSKNDHDIVKELVTWEDLVKVWQSYQASDDVDQAQMESRPADELIILAVQRLLYSPKDLVQTPSKRSTLDLLIAATILDSSMKYSPYNPHLKICAMHVFSDLEAPILSWDQYNDLSIKHIQHESCSYLILPILRSGGMFLEAVSVCREILGLHVSSSRDVPDYIGRAMEAGNMNKAEEFLLFHRDKMMKSLTYLEAKGLILDMAPLLEFEKYGILGAQQGLIGADSDFDRVKQMVSEAHNPNGVFSLLQVHGSYTDLKDTLSDNRDFSVLSYEILLKRQFDTPDIILSESLRRGHQHNLLIRAALCIEATKGPKKGKVIKPTLEAQKRCKSLLEYADSTEELCTSIIPSLSNRPTLLVIRQFCILIAALSSGLDSKGEFVLETLNEREDVVCSAIKKAIKSLGVMKECFTDLSDISTAQICTMMADTVVPIFAIFEMVAKIVDLFGWGKRKQKTKRCSAAVAEFALLFASITDDMRCILDRVLDRPRSVVAEYRAEIEKLSSVVDLETFHTLADIVPTAQSQACMRMAIILNFVENRLALFDSGE